MKIYVNHAHEDWIVDRMRKEFIDQHPFECTNAQDEADVSWLLAEFAWKNVQRQALIDKPVLTSIHHIVPEKFDYSARLDFIARDEVTTAYHVFNQRVHDFIRPLTDKPVHLIKYWCNDSFWKRRNDTTSVKRAFGLDNKYVVLSAQRDTEGHDLRSPKLEKGPDIFVDTVLQLRKTRPDLHVLLGGWRRQYVIGRLEKENVPYTYIERPPLETVRHMYEAADLYIVGSRCEGGPQALLECGLMGTPCISTPVGIAEQVLPQSAIMPSDELHLATPMIPNVNDMKISGGAMQPYIDLLGSLTRK